MRTEVALSFLLLIVSLIISACGSSSLPELTTTPTPIPPTPISLPTAIPTETQVPTPGADEINVSIVNALLTLYNKPNRMESTTVLDDGQTRTNVIEFVPPDRKHIVDMDEGVEYIVVGEKVYAKTKSSGKWEETQIPASTFMGDGEVNAQVINKLVSDVRFIRNDTLDGKPVIVYGYDTNTKAGDIELHSEVELWVGEHDGLPYRMIQDGDIYSASTDSATGDSIIKAVKALITTLISFDPAINIEPPIQ